MDEITSSVISATATTIIQLLGIIIGLLIVIVVILATRLYRKKIARNMPDGYYEDLKERIEAMRRQNSTEHQTIQSVQRFHSGELKRIWERFIQFLKS